MKDFLTETGCIITDMTVLLSVEACGHQVRYLSQCLATITRGEIKWNTLSLLHRSAAANFRIKMRHSNSSTTCLVTSRLLQESSLARFRDWSPLKARNTVVSQSAI